MPKALNLDFLLNRWQQKHTKWQKDKKGLAILDKEVWPRGNKKEERGFFYVPGILKFQMLNHEHRVTQHVSFYTLPVQSFS